MNTEGEVREAESDGEFDEFGNKIPEDTVVLNEMPVSDDGGDTAEIRVDKLMQQVEAQSDKDVHRRNKVRQRLEELKEEMNLKDTYALDLEDVD